MTQNRPTCRDCLHFAYIGMDAKGHGFGECRRNPPAVSGLENFDYGRPSGVWPTIYNFRWCSQHNGGDA